MAKDSNKPTDTKKPVEKKTPERPKRKPITKRNVLTSKARPGYVNRWVNDIDDRIMMFEEAGWKVVRKDSQDTSEKKAEEPSKLGSIVRKAVGGGYYAVLMEIPQEWYDEDQAAKQAEKDLRSEGIDAQKMINPKQ